MIREQLEALIYTGRLKRMDQLISNTPETVKFLVLGVQSDGTWLISIFDPRGFYFNLGGYQENYEEAIAAYTYFLNKYTKELTELWDKGCDLTDSLSDDLLNRLVGRYTQDTLTGAITGEYSPNLQSEWATPLAGRLSLAQYVRSQEGDEVFPHKPIADAWIDLPDVSIRRLCSLYEDGTVSIVDRCTETRRILSSKFDIPLTTVNPFLLLTLWTNATREEQETFIKRHKEVIKEAAWRLSDSE